MQQTEGIIDGETATKIAKHLLKLGNASSNVYVNGIVQAYTYGYYGYGREAMIGKNTLSATLSEEQRNVAYGLAEQYRAAKTEADQKAASGKKRIASEAAGKKRSVAPDGTEYKKVRFEGEIKKWGKKQKAEVEFIDFIAANFSGNTVHVYESYKNAKGQYVYRDSRGKTHPAPNGMYIDSTGDIYLDLNAGNHGEGLVMNTFAHELYHHIERESPQKARKLAEFLVQELGYKNVGIAVQGQIDKAKRAGHGVEYLMKENGISRTAAERLLYDRAFSDFVADSLETMFTKGNVVEALQKLKSQDAGLFNMIKSFIDKWVKRMRQFYRSHSTISIEGDMVSHLKKFEQIQQMFAEALVDAGENFQTAEVQKNTTVEGDIKYSLKGTNRDGIEVYETSEFVKSLSWKERKKLFLNLMRNQYRGRTAKFIRNGHAYYATFEYRDVSKNIYGDTASDPKGRDAKINVGADGNIFELVEHAEYFLSEEEHGKTQRMHRGVKYWDYFIKTVQIDGEVFDVLAHIRKKETGNFVYDIEMYQNKKIEPSSSQDSLESGRNRMPNSSKPIIGEKGEIVNSKPAEAIDIAMDADTESVAPAPLYSERTWTESDYVQEREKAAEEISKAIGVSKKKAKAYIDSVNGIAKMIAEDKESHKGAKFSDRDSDGNQKASKGSPYNGRSLYKDGDVYNYDFMIALPDMEVRTMPPLSSVKTGNRVDQDKAVRLGLKNASSIGREVSDGLYAIKNVYTKREILLGQNGLEHGLDGEDVGRLRTNARLSAIGGLIVQNSVPVNGLKNKNRQAKGTYAMACLLKSGDRDVVAIVTVEEHTSKTVGIDYVDITHSINGRLRKKVKAACLPQGKRDTTLRRLPAQLPSISV